MRALWLTALIGLLAITAVAAEPQVVSYHSGDETVQATLYMPKVTGPSLRWWSSTNGGG